MIELKNLTKRFGNVVAVNRLNLSVSEGEIFGFIGPNGAGKTTTLRMMGGVLAPTEGTVMINGIDMADEPERPHRHDGRRTPTGRSDPKCFRFYGASHVSSSHPFFPIDKTREVRSP
jgi:ABC-type cobalamin/Fe3+-siderophores transport system ATPase subunit